MKTVIIGSGNVAYHLAKALSQGNQNVVQLYGRNSTELLKISEELNIPFSVTELADADLYIISVSDSSISEVSEKILGEDCLVVHTSGSLPTDILKGNYRKGVFYPLQTFSKTKELDYSKIPFFVEAENSVDLKLLKDFASALSEKVTESNYKIRKYIHLTAVFACNFVNHLYARAKEISDSQGIPFEYFLPLIEETTAKIHQMDPKSAQTGPAVRNDQRILELHEALINNEYLKIYKVMNESIKQMYS